MAYEYSPTSHIFDYDDVRLIPLSCVVKSRSEIDVSTEMGGMSFALPVVPANMSTVVNEETSEWLAARGYFYILHRFNVDTVAFTRDMQTKGLYASVSIGIKDEDYQILDDLRNAGLTPEFITVDVAHGDSEEVIKMVKTIRSLFTSFIIAGNVATAESAQRLAEAGADAVKVGIGPGLACSTSPNTGFGTQGWQLSAVSEVAKYLSVAYPNVKVIADGGIRHYGDIAKSVAFGAHFVMVGGMLSGHKESPGSIIEQGDGLFKEFFGSASEFQKGEKRHVEGKRMLVPYRGSIETTLETIKENLQSSVSYAGGKTLEALKNAPYVRIR